jgi:hypothetical protein
MPAYGETVTAQNLVDRIDFHTHTEAAFQNPNRKKFIVDLSHLVLQRVLAAPSAKWLDLGKAIAASFDAGEALIWTDDPATQQAIRSLGWSAEFPSSPGDFYADAEFEFAAKNGSDLQRTFTHVVTLNPDGSGTAATSMLLHDTAAASFLNQDSLSYITPYGPFGASVDPTSDKRDSPVPALNGHPGVGYFRAAQPLGSTKLHVSFRGQALALRRTDGSLLYTLEFRGQSGHTGDILHLEVHPPQGWHWEGARPPATLRLTGTYTGAWVLRRNG